MIAVLSAQEKRRLRTLGRSLRPLAHIGKDGLSAAAVAQVDALLEQHELVKVRLLETVSAERGPLARQLATQTHSVLAAAIGRTICLYRPNPELPAGKRVQLD